MPTPRTPAGSRIFIQSAISAKQAVTGITKAAPPVITYAGTDPVNGNYIALTDVFGMTELEDALVKVANVNATGNTFEAEDQDATGYGTFVSGNMQVVTMDTEILVAAGFTMSGGTQKYGDYQFLWDKTGRRLPTTRDPSSIEIPAIWDPQDLGSKEILKAADKSEKRGFKIVLPDGLEMLFFGYIGASGLPNAQDLNSVMRTSFTIEVATRIRYVFP